MSGTDRRAEAPVPSIDDPATDVESAGQVVVWRVEIEQSGGGGGVHLLADESDAQWLADYVPGNVWVEPVPVLDWIGVLALTNGGVW